MKFCPLCAAPLEERVPAGDDRPRKVCPACDAVHYENPRPVVGCMIEHEERVLLCRRAIEPARGLWTVPAGYLELGEAAVDGALRETREEACADASVIAPHAYFDLPHIGQTYALFRARLARPEIAAGAESLEVGFFGWDEIPWGELAFPVVHFALRLLDDDRRAGARHLHLGIVRWLGRGSRFDPSSYELQDHRRVPIVEPER